MKKKQSENKQSKNLYFEHHSNLALVTTAFAMVVFMILLITNSAVNVENFSQAKFNMALGVAPAAGIGFWILGAVMAVVVVTKKKKYLTEYVIYSLFMGFCLFFVFAPDKLGFIADWLQPTGLLTSVNIYWGTTFVSVAYFVVSIVWHSILATPRKNKKQ